MHTPFSRALTTARQLGDDRKDALTKALGLGLGVKVEDLSGGIERAKAIEARDALNEMAKESPHLRSHTQFYADSLSRDLLTDEEKQNLRLLAGLDKAGRDYSKQMKAAELFQPR